jgi:hypothetical protein
MIRNLKALGLALIAVFAISAVASPAASAEVQGWFTAESYPAHIDAADRASQPGIYTGLFGIGVTCTSADYTGSISASVTELTVTPTYANCHSTNRQVTFTANTCDYVFTDATAPTTNSDDWSVKTDLLCQTGNKIEIHIYGENERPHTVGGLWCTLTVEGGAGQNKNLTGLTAENTTTASPKKDIDFDGTVLNFRTQTHGPCSAGLTINFNAEFDIHMTLTGTTVPGGAAQGIEID